MSKKISLAHIDWVRIFLYSVSVGVVVAALTGFTDLGLALRVFIVYFLLTFFSELMKKTKPDDNPKILCFFINKVVEPPFYYKIKK